jgi:hypothetical protein
LSIGQPFGRFGYEEGATLPSFFIGRTGFSVRAKGASHFDFMEKTDAWRCTEISDTLKAAIVSAKGRAPRKVRMNLLAPGFSMFFEAGFSFTVDSPDCPYLTWKDGSVGANVPTPPTDWVMVSFQNAQPPVLFYFPGGQCSVRVDGSSGAWVVRSVELNPCWIRVVAPLGKEAAPTASARDLGTLQAKVLPNLDLWTAAEPTIKGVDVKSDDVSVICTWHLDHALAIMPEASLLAPLGGYPIQIGTPVRDVGIATEEGPVEVSSGEDIEIRFPVQKLLPGRALVDGSQTGRPDVSGMEDIPGIVAVALGNLESACDPRERDTAARIGARFINEGKDYPEPITGQNLPYQEDGKGADVAAAYALLAASDLATSGSDMLANPLALSLLLKRDWGSWTLECTDQELGRRCTALMAVACTLGGHERLRLDGAMLQAGLAAQRGLGVWRSAHEKIATTTFTEPLDEIRQALFSTGDPSSICPFVGALKSPVTVYAAYPVTGRDDTDGIAVSWLSQDATPKEFTVAWAEKVHAEKGKNVLTIASHQVVLGVSIRALPADVGRTEIKVKGPSTPTIPKYVPQPAYAESKR